MKKAVVGIIVVVLLGIFALYLWGNRFPLMHFAVRVHATRGSIDCGTVTNSNGNNGKRGEESAIKCATSADERHLPFFVVFSGNGIDAQISNALVSDGKGNVIQLFYATGVVSNHKLLKSRCEVPVKLVVEENTPYGFPRVHCAPWPPPESNLSTDFLLW